MTNIITTSYRLRHSGRMCYEGWDKLLSGLGKRKADHEALTGIQCLQLVGFYDTLWMLPTEEQHSTALRGFAVSLARSVVHLADDPAASHILDTVEAFLQGRCGWPEVGATVPGYLQPHTWDQITSDDWWSLYDPEQAATIAAVMTTIPDGCSAPFAVAHLVEVALVKSSDDPERAGKAVLEDMEAKLKAFLLAD